MTVNISLLEAYAEADQRAAHAQNAVMELAELESMINDCLTGQSDYWLKTQLLDQLFAVKDNLRKAAM